MLTARLFKEIAVVMPDSMEDWEFKCYDISTHDDFSRYHLMLENKKTDEFIFIAGSKTTYGKEAKALNELFTKG